MLFEKREEVTSGWPGFGGIFEESVFLHSEVQEGCQDEETSSGQEKRDIGRAELQGRFGNLEHVALVPGASGGQSQNYCPRGGRALWSAMLRHHFRETLQSCLPWTVLARDLLHCD